MIKKYKKDISQKQEKIAKNVKKRKQQSEQMSQQQRLTGVVTRGKRIGNYQYAKADEEFIAEDELKETIRHVKANSNLIRETFDNYLRRGLIEPVDPSKPVKR
jgi:hypothetical protein